MTKGGVAPFFMADGKTLNQKRDTPAGMKIYIFSTTPVVQMTFTKPSAIVSAWLLAAGLVFLFCHSSQAQKLEITGQKDLSVEKGKSITLQLSDFTVKGSGDDQYPTDFRLEVFKDKNYSVSGTTVTPDAGFTGQLKVVIRIARLKDGKVKAETKKTDIIINVKASAPPPQVNEPPQIIGQIPINVLMNQTVQIVFDHLTVVDPDNDYPTGFTIKLAAGANFTIASGNTVVPAVGFVGTLTVKTIVNDGKMDSRPFDLKINVLNEDSTEPPPPGGAPIFVTFSEGQLGYSLGNRQFLVAREVEIADPDSEELFYAEVFFDAENFLPGKDFLTIETSGNITSVFDSEAGMLVIFGRESLARYQQALRSVRYYFDSDTMPSATRKQIHFRLNDGENSSETRSKMIVLNEIITLDIPNVFSPNDDNANDLWVIRPSRDADDVKATVRVFDGRGVVLFETNDLLNFWDGKSNGQFVPPDSYYYTIDVASGVNRVKHQGVVTVLRQ